MLLRSSSTPVLGSLLADSSSNHHHRHHPPEIATPNHNFKKALCSHNIGKLSCNSSPISPSVSEFSNRQSSNGFRKVFSDGNLEGLAVVHDPRNIDDEFSLAVPLKKFSGLNGLETIPSFSFHGSRIWDEDDESDEEDESEAIDEGLEAEMGMKVAERGEEMSVKVAESREVCLVGGNGVAKSCGGGGGPSGGSGGCGGSGGGGYIPVAFDRGGGDSHGFGIEDHYKKMLEDNPSNPLFLRNYAHFLYQTKGDFKGAEEYYSRAILADPGDGEVLSQYAKLVWELHHDADRATSYFEMAVRAASEDSHVHAAYANFLWEIEDDVAEEDDEPRNAHKPMVTYPGSMASATAC